MKAFPRTCLGALLLGAVPVEAQDRPWRSHEQIANIPRAELDAITDRGWQMVLHWQAGWMAIDAVQAISPRPELVSARLVRERQDGRYEVAFGALNATSDTFLLAVRAEQVQPRAPGFRTFEMRPPARELGYYLRAARALDVTSRDFGTPARPYYSLVIPVRGSGDWYVYFLPSQTVSGVWPHGGDVRYRVSVDGRTIVERTRMHNAVIEVAAPDTANLVAMLHANILDDRPADSDVFYAIVNKPRRRQLIGSKSYYFSVDTLGRIMAYNRDTTIKR